MAKAKKFLHLIKPALHHIWGLNPKRMQWIYKQIILPRLTYGCLVWGHSMTNSHIQKIETVERVAMQCYASTWKKTPTASLQIILNQMPSHIDIMYVSIKTYIRCKHVFQNNHWDGIADYALAFSHLKTIKSKCHEISHEGTPLDEFHSNFMMDPYYSWNPPIRTTLTAIGSNDIDDCQINLDDNDNNEHDDDPIPTGTFGGGDPSCNRMEIRPLRGDPSSQVYVGVDQTLNNTTTPETEICQGLVATQNMTPPGAEICIGEIVPQHLIPSNISKSTQLTLDQFDKNYRLFLQRLKNDDSNLTIRVVLLKNNLMFRNYTFKILGT